LDLKSNDDSAVARVQNKAVTTLEAQIKTKVDALAHDDVKLQKLKKHQGDDVTGKRPGSQMVAALFSVDGSAYIDSANLSNFNQEFILPLLCSMHGITKEDSTNGDINTESEAKYEIYAPIATEPHS
jgi:hypothetical protein